VNGTRITTTTDGQTTGIGPTGNALSASQVRDQLRTIEQEIHRTEQQIDALRRQRNAARSH
jgi:hypothetical protein